VYLAKIVTSLNELLGEFGIKLSQSTLWTEERMKWCLMPDTEPIKHTTVPLSFNIEVSHTFCGYGSLLHLDITIWTMALTH
jgi:hypothetical protein